MNTPITPKENYKRACRHENPMWVPMRSDEIMFCPRIIPDNIARAWVVEANKYDGPVGGKDMFGIDWVYVPDVGGSMVKPGNPALKDISEWRDVIKFPNIDEWDWEGSAKENEEYLKSDKLMVYWIFSGMFERLISFMDFEESLVALIDEDQVDDVKDLFQALTDFYKVYIKKVKDTYNVDAVFFHDDWGGQKAPFFSVDTCREVIAPYLKELVDYCHSIDVIFYFHCCGKNELLVPVMVECGMDAWAGQPINDKKKLIEEYGDKILIGSTDTMHPMPDSPKPTEEEAEKMVNEYLKDYKDGLPKNIFYLNDLAPCPEVREAFFEASSKLLVS